MNEASIFRGCSSAKKFSESCAMFGSQMKQLLACETTKKNQFRGLWIVFVSFL